MGAEEKDLDSGYRIIDSMKGVSCYDLKLDLEKKIFRYNFLFEQKAKSLNWKDLVNYIRSRFLALDRSMTEGFTYKNYKFVIQLIEALAVDMIFTNTRSTVLFGSQRYVPHIFRSVCFEPIYVLRVVRGLLRKVAHSVLKFLSQSKELKADSIMAISPRDITYYKKFSPKKFHDRLFLMPLRQFESSNSLPKTLNSVDKFNAGFLGSSYNILHNKKSFEFITQNLTDQFLVDCDIILNIYGRKIPNINSRSGNLIIHNWVNKLEDIYKLNQCFIVPHFLSSGMQSKVFEPLLFGKILICDTRVLAGYELEPYVHYLPAQSGDDFKSRLVWVKNNFEKAIEIAEQGAIMAHELFGKERILSQTKILIEKYKKN